MLKNSDFYRRKRLLGIFRLVAREMGKRVNQRADLPFRPAPYNEPFGGNQF